MELGFLKIKQSPSTILLSFSECGLSAHGGLSAERGRPLVDSCEHAGLALHFPVLTASDSLCAALQVLWTHNRHTHKYPPASKVQTILNVCTMLVLLYLVRWHL